MLRKTRRILALVVFSLTTLLFLDFTGTLHLWFGWLAKIQLIPAILAVNVAVIVGLALLTLLFGRLYCSVICPLGIFQDGISNMAGRKKGKKNRFSYSPAKSKLRNSVLGFFAGTFIIMLLGGTSVIVSLLDPYAAYGRIASNLFAPLYRWANNLLAWFAERFDSYTFYSVDVWIKGGISFGIAVVTIWVISTLARRSGRTYCNTFCPVGTLLGLISRFSIFKVKFNNEKCTSCKLCERRCKASCIDSENKHIDHSRCVSCFNCVDSCKFDAMHYGIAKSQAAKTDKEVDVSRRKALSAMLLVAVGSTLKAQQLRVDGGLADIEDKKVPDRKTPIVPPGAESAKNMAKHCTACQLCISACPNKVLRPSNKLSGFMQPEMSFEKGYCRPECTECSQVCPAGAIKAITPADKSAISIGSAVWIKDNCVVNTDNVQCHSCERHCPTGAVTLVEGTGALKTPAINKELCIGCGACEFHCPARPFSAIYVEGNLQHHQI